jgi:hypothetical protein
MEKYDNDLYDIIKNYSSFRILSKTKEALFNLLKHHPNLNNPSYIQDYRKVKLFNLFRNQIRQFTVYKYTIFLDSKTSAGGGTQFPLEIVPGRRLIGYWVVRSLPHQWRCSGYAINVEDHCGAVLQIHWCIILNNIPDQRRGPASQFPVLIARIKTTLLAVDAISGNCHRIKECHPKVPHVLHGRVEDEARGNRR